MTHHPSHTIARIITLLILIFNLISCSNNEVETIDYKDSYKLEGGGNLVNAMVGEPSNLIAMIAGDSASSVIAGNIFTSVVRSAGSLRR